MFGYKSTLNCMCPDDPFIFTNLKVPNHLDFDEFWNCILFISTLSKNAKSFVVGFSLLATNSIFLDLIVWRTSVETIFDPIQRPKYFTYFILNTPACCSGESSICKLVLISKCSSSCNGNTTTLICFPLCEDVPTFLIQL